MNGAPEKDRDRNLLFGVLAVQLKGVSPHQVIEAASAWMVTPDKPLSERLLQIGAITEWDAELINGLVDEAVRMHSGDISAALDSLPGSQNLRQSLTAASMGQRPPVDATRPMDPRFNFGEKEVELSALDETPGRYSFVSEHGRGGMGRVLLVHDEYLGRDIALKELLLPHDTDPPGPQPSPMRESTGLLARFLQEARITGQLEHPSIIPVYELGRRVNGTLYYTMKLVRGKTLSTMIRNAGTLEKRLALLSSVVDLCQAIAYAHSRGIIHRDIKPSNLMVGEFGETVVLDWGLARIEGQEDAYEEKFKSTLAAMRIKRKDKGSPVTSTGEALGTPHYMPPEQAEGRVRELDQRSDIYSVGAVLYELLTGQPPYDGSSAEDILMQVLQAHPKPVKELAPDAPDELVSICEKALQKDPAKRYQKLTDMRDDIRAFQTGAIVSVATYSTGDMLRRYYRAHRTVINAGLASAAALLIMGVYSYFNILAARDREYTQRLAAEDAARKETIAREKETEARAEADDRTYHAQLSLAQAHLEAGEFELASNSLWDTTPSQRGWEWGYLLNEAHPEIDAIEDPDADIMTARFSPDNHTFVATRSNGAPAIYDAITGDRVIELEDAQTQCVEMIFSPTGKWLAGPGINGKGILWEVATGKIVAQIPGSAICMDAAFQPDESEVFFTFNDGEILRVNLGDGSVVARLHTRAPNANQILKHPVEPWLYVTTEADKTEVINGVTGEEMFGVDGHATAMNPTGENFATLTSAGSVNATIVLYDCATGAALHRLEVRDGAIFTLAYSRDGKYLLSAGKGGDTLLWEVASGKIVQKFFAENFILFAEFLQDGRYVITGEGGHVFRVWDTVSGQIKTTYRGRGQQMRLASLSPDGSRMLSAAESRVVQLWNPLQSSGVESILFGPTDFVTDLTNDIAVAKDGKLQAIPLGSTQLGIFRDGATADYALLMPEITPAGNSSSSLSDDGSLLLRVSDSATPYVWNTATKSVQRIYTGHDTALRAGVISPDGSQAATIDATGALRLWATSGDATDRLVDTGSRQATVVQYLPDGKRLLVGTAQGDLLEVAGDAAAPVIVIDSNADPIQMLAINRSRNQVATVSKGGLIRVLDLDTQAAEIARTSMSGQNLTQIYFDPAGDYFYANAGATAREHDYDIETSVWHADDWRRLVNMKGAPISQPAGSTDVALALHANGQLYRMSYPTLAPLFEDDSRDVASARSAYRKMKRDTANSYVGTTTAAPKTAYGVYSRAYLLARTSDFLDTMETKGKYDGIELRWLGISQSDKWVALDINGSRHDTIAQGLQAWRDALTNAPVNADLTITNRFGDTRLLHLQTFEIPPRVHDIRVTKDTSVSFAQSVKNYAYREFNGFFGDPAQKKVSAPRLLETDWGNPNLTALMSVARITMIDGQPLGNLAEFIVLADTLFDDLSNGRRDTLEITAIRDTTDVFTVTIRVEPTRVAATKHLESVN